MEALNQDPGTFIRASDQLKNDRAFAMKVVDKWGLALRWLSSSLQDDHSIILKAAKNNPEAFRYAGRWAYDLDTVKAFVTAKGREALPHIPETMANHPEVQEILEAHAGKDLPT